MGPVRGSAKLPVYPRPLVCHYVFLSADQRHSEISRLGWVAASPGSWFIRGQERAAARGQTRAEGCLRMRLTACFLGVECTVCDGGSVLRVKHEGMKRIISTVLYYWVLHEEASIPPTQEASLSPPGGYGAG